MFAETNALGSAWRARSGNILPIRVFQLDADPCAAFELERTAPPA
ncbi:hypothetical protein [Sorangium sp. So ce124]